jgi:hypothetical protein
MPRLTRNITGSVYSSETGVVGLTRQLEGLVGEGDYFTVYGLTVIQQDFSKVEESVTYNKPTRYGVMNKFNKTMVELEIDL